MVKQINACCSWDITLPQGDITIEELKKLFKHHAKAWCFQLEKGDKTGYLHYQCRISLKSKERDCFGIIKLKGKYSPTSKENMNNYYYVTKDFTKLEGPFKHDDEEVYIPRQYRGIVFKTWQHKIAESRNDFNDRHINVLYDRVGGLGKSTLASICELLYNAVDLPPINTATELMQIMCNICVDQELRAPGLVFLDMPRATDKSALYGLYSACEQIKKGKLYDSRYHFKKWWIDSPSVWIFTNELPDTTMLSADRWKIWEVKDGDLKPFEATKVCNNIKRIKFNN